MISKITNAFNSVLLFLRIYWLHLNQIVHRWFLKPLFFTPKPSLLKHSVVVIGDGFAEGYGDWVILFGNAGIAEKIPKILNAKKSVRQHWTFFNRGHYGSTSFDWLPDTYRKPTHFQIGVNRSLFYDTFEAPDVDPRIKSAEIVLLCVGSVDHLNGGPDGQLPSKTFQNIVTISEALAAKGKTVVVSQIPLGMGGNKRVHLDERNKLIQKWLESKPERIVAGPEANTGQFRQSFISDGLHYNSAGYTLFSTLWIHTIKNLMLQVEYKSFQAVLKEGAQKKKAAQESTEKKETENKKEK